MALTIKIFRKIHEYSILVMFQHTIFSISFGLVAMLIAAHGLPDWKTFIWLLAALLSARTGANAINRVIDVFYDEKNPRTRLRQLPQKKLSAREVILFSGVCFAVFFIAAGQINRLTLLLSPLAFVFMIGYSYTKRFTAWCHLILGFTCCMAPVGAYIAVTGEMTAIPIFLGAANLFWVAGFDVIYGAQDVEFDHSYGLHSIPATFGVADGLIFSSIFHGFSFFSLVIVGFLVPEFGIIYSCGLLLIGGLLILEHVIVQPNKLQHASIASYNVNELVSVVFLIAGCSDIFL